MKKNFFLFLFLLAIFPGLAKAEVYRVNLYIEKDGKLVFDQKSNQTVQLLANNFVEGINLSGNYRARIVSFGDAILNVIYFTPKTVIFSDWIDPETGKLAGKKEVLSAGPFKLILPYYPNAKYAEIFDDGNNKLLKIYLSAFARCNENKICDSGETENDCPGDCLKKAAAPSVFSVYGRYILILFSGLAIIAIVYFIVRFIKRTGTKKQTGS